MFHAKLVLILLAGLCGSFADDAEEARRQIDEVLEGWRQGPRHTEGDLIHKLVSIGPNGRVHLCTLVDQRSDRTTLRALASALGQMGGSEAVDTLARLLSSTDSRLVKWLATLIRYGRILRGSK